MNPVLIIAIIVILMLLLIFVPNRQTKQLNRLFKKTVQKLSTDLEGQHARVQGRALKISNQGTFDTHVIKSKRNIIA